ncbi:fermitin family homolog 3-like, partial [Larus michahellis]|uniref:fermitin family homolog 3-like n=1 Tax=Larus michahellis TaxID=119627 RepID=UPI003D9BA012
IGHPEELSLLRPEEEEEEEGWGGAGGRRKARGPPPPPDVDLTHLPPPAGEEEPPPPPLPPGTRRLLMAPWGGKGPVAPPRGNPLLRRARLHARWLDSSRSLLEQDVGDEDELLLRLKYHCFLQPDPQREGLRLALLYEEARWALLREEIDCTQEEMLLFAALQYHIDEVGGSEELGGAGGGDAVEDLETALSNLEVKLGGEPQPPAALEELGTDLELAEELEVYRPRRLPLGGGFRPARALLKGTTLSITRGPPGGEPPQQLNLRGCGVTPEVDVGGQKFGIKLLVAAPEGMSEIQLRCRDAPQYARWVAACRLAARGGGAGGGALGAEARGVLGVLGLQPGGAPAPAPPRAPPDPRRLLPPRLQRKGKGKQLVPRILEALHRLGALSAAEARLRFLEAWRALPGFGLAYFVVRFKGGRRDELLALGPSRLLRMDPASGAVTRVWRYSGLRQWNVNWDSQQVTLELEGEVTLALGVLSAPCRVLHEFLGGYLCLGGRRPGQPLDQRLLEQLTGGPDAP